MANVLAELLVKISADTKDLNKQLGDAEKQARDSFGNIADASRQVGIALTAMGAVIVGAMAVAIKSFAGLGTELKELSQKTGISVESLSELKYVGDMTSVSLGDLAVAIRGMANFMETASSGSEEAAKTLAKLGLRLDDIKGLNPEQLFMKLSSVIAALPDPIKRSALAVDVFGRSGTALLPMLAEGQDGIVKLRQKARELGITMSTETAEAADALGDALDTVKSSIGGVFNAIGNQLAPIIIDLTGKVADILGKIKGWSDAHPELSKNIILVVGGLGLLALAIGPILIMLPQLMAQWVALKIALVTVSAAMGPVGWAIAAISAALVIALPWILGATNETRNLTGAMSGLEQQTFRNNIQLKLGSQSWATIQEQGYLSAQTFKYLADNLGLTTEELIRQFEAAGMLRDVMTNRADTNIYIQSLDRIKQGLEKATDATRNLKDITQGTKQAMGYATWTADGYTFSMQLFTQAEIEAAKASGKKVEVLKTQSDVMADNTAKAKNYTAAIDSASASVGGFITSLGGVPTTTTGGFEGNFLAGAGVAAEQVGRIGQAQGLLSQGGDIGTILSLLLTSPGKTISLNESKGIINQFLAQAQGKTVGELPAGTSLVEGIDLYAWAKDYAQQTLEHYTGIAEGGKAWGYAGGGIAWHPQIASLAETEPEAIIPLSKLNQGITINFTEPVFFDREDSMNKFIDKITKGIDRKYRLRFGGAYSG